MTTTTEILGSPLARVEGPLKVTGTARYTAEHPMKGLTHAWVVHSPIARGRVRSVDTAPTLGVPGVIEVLWHGNAPTIGQADDPELAVLQSPQISYRGQVVALIVATSPEVAREASRTLVLDLDLEEEPHDVELRPDHPDFYAPDNVNPNFPTDTAKGDAEAGLARSAVVVDQTYTTAAMHNNPMEPHATVARWDAGALTVWDSTQGSSVVAADLSTVFGIPLQDVHVIAEHIGGGFGSKGSARPNVVLAALAARVTGRPVQLALPRQALFSMVGYRTPTRQRIQLGADNNGVLQAITHDVWEQSSHLFEFAEQTAVATRHMYAAPDRRTTHRLVRLDVPTPRWMRAPGEAPGMFALESAMDELAAALGIDPVELRVRNEPVLDPEDDIPFSSRQYLTCLREGAERFGWAGRDHRARQRRDGEWWVGTGVSGATYPAMSQPSTARATATPDGRFAVAIAAADIGQGARTVLLQIAASALGVPTERVDIAIGDSSLPKASVAGGSSGTASWGRAVTGACTRLRDQLGDGPVPAAGVSVTHDTTDELADAPELSQHAFGAHFAEVRVSSVTGEVRVPRMLGVFSAGRVLNPRTARSQFLGGMVMGLGMALHEESLMDASGSFLNHDLAEYHVPVHADIGTMEAYWVDDPDDSLNPMGSKGIGEIGNVGSAAAVANAVWHATGIRVRDLPVRLDKLLPGVLVL